MESDESPIFGKATERERALIDYLGNCLANYGEKNQIDRRELVCALFCMCRLVFTDQTPLDVKAQCDEIDDFCRHLKDSAKEK
jgi:hypothetical protein